MFVGFGIGWLMVQLGQWGGGDAKALMGIGANFGTFGSSYLVPDLATGWFPQLGTSTFIAVFFVNLILVGAAYGIVWMLIEASVRHKLVYAYYKKHLCTKKAQTIKVALALACMILLFVAWYFPVIRMHVAALSVIIIGSAILLCVVRAIEKEAHVYDANLARMTPGEWVVNDVWVTRPNTTVFHHLEEMHQKRMHEQYDDADRKHILAVLGGIPGFTWVESWYTKYVQKHMTFTMHDALTQLQKDFTLTSEQAQKMLVSPTKSDLKKLEELYAYRADKEYIAGPRADGISQQQIDRLQELGYKSLKIKVGIPFIPAFMVAYVLTVWLGLLPLLIL
jgi:hypothetical protein